MYRSALGHLPKRKEPKATDLKGKEKENISDDDDEPHPEPATSSTEVDGLESDSDRASSKARAALNANVGACYVHMAGIHHFAPCT